MPCRYRTLDPGSPSAWKPLRADTLSVHGGDTLFADLAAAYAKTPDDWKVFLEGAEGIHSYDMSASLRSRVHQNPVEDPYWEIVAYRGPRGVGNSRILHHADDACPDSRRIMHRMTTADKTHPPALPRPARGLQRGPCRP